MLLMPREDPEASYDIAVERIFSTEWTACVEYKVLVQYSTCDADDPFAHGRFIVWHREGMEGLVGQGQVISEQMVNRWVLRPVYLRVFSSIWWPWLVLQLILKPSLATEVYVSDLANSLGI